MLSWRAESQTPKTESQPAAAAVQKLTVETIDNHVYFYSEVDEDRTLALLRTIRETDSRLRNESFSRMLPEGYPAVPIWLHIQSPGGGLFAAFAVADQISRIQTPVYSIVEGYAASAATIISVACSKRFILSSGFMLIHQLSSGHWGKYEESKDKMHLLDMAMVRLVGFYTRRTKMTEETIRETLKRDSWFEAQECVDIGLVDNILL